jgi:hypothetical protein
MRGVQDQWTRLVDVENKKMSERSDEVPSGLVEYVIALANDHIKSAGYTDALSARLEPLISEKYRVTINERLNDAIDGYPDVAKKCTQTSSSTTCGQPRSCSSRQPVRWQHGVAIVQIV